MAAYDELIGAASKACIGIDADVYLYNGPIARGHDLQCIEAVAKHVAREAALLILVTGGGDPDAAYKMSRYLQDRYGKFTVLVSGFCKSAGTLVALGAHELAFMPFGELGPLDIQLGRVDRFDAPQSGLAIQEALDTLEGRACNTFYSMVNECMQDNSGLLSFPAASRAAADFIANLYAPIFARIDPEEVGARSRSMRIAREYGQRLAVGSQNLNQDTLSTLAEKYPSHSFVIDRREAEKLFKNVRGPTDAERDVVAALGKLARFPVADARLRPNQGPMFHPLSNKPQPPKDAHDAQADTRTGDARDGAAAPADARPPGPKAGQAKPNGDGRAAKARRRPRAEAAV